MARPFKIFISSPGDVMDERRRASLVITRLAREFKRFYDIKPVLWEYGPMLSSGHFQDIIDPPSDVAWPVWAGHVPARLVFGPPVPDGDLPASVDPSGCAVALNPAFGRAG